MTAKTPYPTYPVAMPELVPTEKGPLALPGGNEGSTELVSTEKGPSALPGSNVGSSELVSA